LLLLGHPQKGRIGRQPRGVSQAPRQLCEALRGRRTAQEAQASPGTSSSGNSLSQGPKGWENLGFLRMIFKKQTMPSEAPPKSSNFHEIPFKLARTK